VAGETIFNGGFNAQAPLTHFYRGGTASLPRVRPPANKGARQLAVGDFPFEDSGRSLLFLLVGQGVVLFPAADGSGLQGILTMGFPIFGQVRRGAFVLLVPPLNGRRVGGNRHTRFYGALGFIQTPVASWVQLTWGNVALDEREFVFGLVFFCPRALFNPRAPPIVLLGGGILFLLGGGKRRVRDRCLLGQGRGGGLRDWSK